MLLFFRVCFGLRISFAHMYVCICIKMQEEWDPGNSYRSYDWRSLNYMYAYPGVRMCIWSHWTVRGHRMLSCPCFCHGHWEYVCWMRTAAALVGAVVRNNEYRYAYTVCIQPCTGAPIYPWFSEYFIGNCVRKIIFSSSLFWMSSIISESWNPTDSSITSSTSSFFVVKVKHKK